MTLYGPTDSKFDPMVEMLAEDEGIAVVKHDGKVVGVYPAYPGATIPVDSLDDEILIFVRDVSCVAKGGVGPEWKCMARSGRDWKGVDLTGRDGTG